MVGSLTYPTLSVGVAAQRRFVVMHVGGSGDVDYLDAFIPTGGSGGVGMMMTSDCRMIVGGFVDVGGSVEFGTVNGEVL